MLHPKSLARNADLRIALLLLVAAELWAFSGAFQKYFNLDSAFYVIHAPRTLSELRQTFTAPDAGRQYRPLTLGFMALFVPSFKLNPHPYHWIPILFHIANTFLLYGLARRLLNGTVAVLAATAFWGIHSVAGWITYDTTCISDCMLAFFLLAALVLAVEGSLRHSFALFTGSILCYVLALLSKEAAVTGPLALLICLVLVHTRSQADAPESATFWRAFRKALPLTGIFLGLAVVHAGILFRWFRAGLLYAQGEGAAYNINPWTSFLAKAKYLYWALNLPDALHFPDAKWIPPLTFGLMGILFVCLFLDIVKRKGRLQAAGWAGLVWLIGMNVPALMLSHRLAKWYLYVPLIGFSLTLGTLAQSLCDRLNRVNSRVAVAGVLALCIIPSLFSSVVQTRSYLKSSDAVFASDLLQSFFRDVQETFSQPPARTTILLLPSFEPETVTILSSPPIDSGRLLELHYPGTLVKMLFAHKRERLSSEQLRDPNTRVLQDLYGRFNDVTEYYRSNGRMTLYVLPTAEGKAPPLLKKEPPGGRQLFESHVQMLLADEGAVLPEDYQSRDDLWILQYLNGRFVDVTGYFTSRGAKELILLPTLDGKIPPLRDLKKDAARIGIKDPWHVRLPSGGQSSRLKEEDMRRPELCVLQYLGGHFNDVTDFYKARLKDSALRLVPSLESLQVSVNRIEFYPTYERFDTPTGAPVFFPTPEKEILTQIGGSTATIPIGPIPSEATLRFDVSWMFEDGDGGWAEMRLRLGRQETVVFQQYMQPNPKGNGLTWKEVKISLRPFAGQQGELILRCYNDRGKNTVADWLNWRDIAIEIPPVSASLKSRP